MIFERIIDGIVALDADWNYVYLNPQAARMLGRDKPEDLIGKNYWTEHPGSQTTPFGKALLEAMATQQEGKFEGYSEHRSRWFENRICPSRDGLTIILNEITERKQTIQAALEAKDHLELLTSHLRNVREEERARISREIHDELGQSLTALSIDLGWLHDQAEISIDSRKKLASMIQIVAGTIGNVQRIASDLRPAILDDLGLTAAVEWYCDDFEERSAIHCETVLEDVEPVESRMKLHMFRLFQESLTNVARHSLATSVSVHLMREADEITLEIVDDGIGIEERKIGASTSLGILGMRERVKECHGRMTVARGPVKGTTVVFTLPAGG